MIKGRDVIRAVQLDNLFIHFENDSIESVDFKLNTI